MEEIEKNGYNLNISRYVSTAMSDEMIDLKAVNDELIDIEKKTVQAANKHNQFLKELGLPPVS
jgi:type I restriction enzyme M protein